MKKWKKSEQRLSESGKKLIQFVEACLLNSLQRSKGTYVSAFLLLRIFFHWGGRRIVCNGNKGDDENKDWIGRKRERQQSMSASNFFECFYEKERESERERGRVTEIKCTSNSVTKNLLYLRIVPKWRKVVPFQESHAKSWSILGYFFPKIITKAFKSRPFDKKSPNFVKLVNCRYLGCLRGCFKLRMLKHA